MASTETPLPGIVPFYTTSHWFGYISLASVILDPDPCILVPTTKLFSTPAQARFPVGFP